MKSKRKTTIVSMRCTEEQKKTLEKKAEGAGMPVGGYILRAALNGRTRIRKKDEDIIRCIVQMQNELNEIKLLQEQKRSGLGAKENGFESFIKNMEEALGEIWRLSR